MHIYLALDIVALVSFSSTVTPLIFPVSLFFYVVDLSFPPLFTILFVFVLSFPTQYTCEDRLYYYYTYYCANQDHDISNHSFCLLLFCVDRFVLCVDFYYAYLLNRFWLIRNKVTRKMRSFVCQHVRSNFYSGGAGVSMWKL